MDKANLVDIMSSKIKNVFVTCLKCDESNILAGQGGNLHIFDYSKSKPENHKNILSHVIFPSQSIHGIIPYNENILVFGGKHVSIITRKCNYRKSNDFDCIDIKCSGSAKDWILDGVWSDDDTIILLTAHNVLLQYTVTPVLELVNEAISAERCILYSGKILGSSFENIFVIAGTVYQEVIIWTPHDDNDDGNSNFPVLQRLQGHKGVIFSTAYDHENQCIASTSDDRTVRVWSVKFPDDDKSISYKWANAEVNLSFTAFGHTARVWRCLFTSSGHLLTVGEDSYICYWDMAGNLVNRWQHSGEIWCIDNYEEQIVVGGNGITMRSLSGFPEISSLMTSEIGTPRRSVLNAFGSAVVSSDKGFLIKQENNVTSTFCKDERFSSYCTIAVSPSRAYIALGGISGDVVVYRENEFIFLNHLNIDHEKVYSLAWVNENIFVSCGENGCISIMEVNYTQVEGLPEVVVINKVVLPPSKERWITCAIVIGDLFICGDRMGSLHLYSLSSTQKDPLDTYSKLHGTKGVSDVKFINGMFYSTGRDGTFRELDIIDLKFHLVSTLKLPMDWAVSINKSEKYGLLIAGFHDVNFVLWNVEERITLLVLDCGGGHRSFDYLIDELNGNLILTYIRMKEVKYLSCPIEKLAHQTLLASYHMKSINASCLIHRDNGRTVVLTGGEDNTLRLSSLNGNGWEVYSTYIRHISAVRTVKCLNKIAVSGGARAQLILWAIMENAAGKLYLKELTSHMIRNDKEHHKSWKDAKPLIDPEMRYMDIEISKRSENDYDIFAACSDGMMRILKYDVTTNELYLWKSIESDQGCLLRILSYHWKEKLGVITGGTKGTVAFWKEPFEGRPQKAHSVHSLGVNAIDHMVIGNNLILASGGDDTSISLTMFSLSLTKPEQILFNIVERIHSCQVSGIRMTSNFVISASLDQKICLLHWKLDGCYLKTTFVGHHLTSIPDIHGILAWTKNEKQEKDLDILIFGCGFQLVHFNGSAVAL